LTLSNELPGQVPARIQAQPEEYGNWKQASGFDYLLAFSPSTILTTFSASDFNVGLATAPAV
jgi:hypothetical protein